MDLDIRSGVPPARLAVALIAFGVVLRLAFLGADSLWLDEAYSVSAVLAHTARETWETTLDVNHPPLYFVVLRASLRLFGTSEAAARLPSALASISGLGVLFVLARRLGLSKGAAVSAVLLLTFAPVDIWYAQEARMYEMVATAGIVFAVALTMDSWMGAGLTWAALTAGLYLDFTMMPLSAALTTLWLVRWWHTGRPPWQLARVTVASLLAWWCFRPRWTHLGQVLLRIHTVPLFVNLRDWFGMRLSPGPPVTIALVLMTATVGIGAVVLWNRLGNRLGNRRFRTWWIWSVAAGFVLCTAVLTIPRAYSLKQYLATGWPFVALVTAWTLTDCDDDTQRRGAVATLARLRLPIALGVSVIAAIVTVATPRTDWRGVVSYLNARAPGTRVVLDPAYDSGPYDYYRPKIAPVASPLEGAASFVGQEAAGAQVCLVAERFGRTPPTSPTEAWLDGHFALAEVVPFARLELRCYRNRPGPADIAPLTR